MRRFVLALGLCAGLWPAAGSAQDYFQQHVDYNIAARLDAKEHMLTGTENIVYRNNSPDTLRTFYLHLYPNGYRGKESELAQDYARRFNAVVGDIPESRQSYLNITEVTIDDIAVTPLVDDTIAEITLPAPIPPGGAVVISMRFEEKIRRHVGRAGYLGDHYDMAQWYPKVVVYDENGWHPDKFRSGEFYGEFGNFDVTLQVPERFVVVATGELQEGDAGWQYNPAGSRRGNFGGSRSNNDLKTIRFTAEDVHDFAWCADPNYVVESTQVDDIDVRSVYRRNNKAWRDSTLAHAERTLRWLQQKVGPYPYPQVTVVDALLSGGMEYPMLVMDGRVSEGLVMHEIAHIYFYGILANNERAEAWLDEGFATFMTSLYLSERYGEYGDERDWNWYQKITPQFTELGKYQDKVFPLERDDRGERIATPAHEFENSYYNMVYRKTTLMLYALRYVVGEDDLDRILKEYYSRWQLKHVNEQRFVDVCEQISGQDLSWFFETWLHSRKTVDYRLQRMETKASDRGDGYTTVITIQREGELVMPIELELTFADGSTERTRIDGRLRTIKQTFELPEPPRKAAVNPQNEIADLNMSDNFLPRKRSLGVMWPNNSYYPEYAPQVRWRPGIWRNDIDEARVGLHLRRSLFREYNRMHLGVHYATKTGRVDFEASLYKKVNFLGRRGEVQLSGYKLEGRQDFVFALNLFQRKSLIHPPTQRIDLGFSYHELTRIEYVANPETYQLGPEFFPFVKYSIFPQLDILRISIATELRLGRDWFSTDWRYSRLYLDASTRTRPGFVPFDLGFRMFIGYASGNLPFQDKFQLGYGGPLAEDQRFWLRAPGAVPEDLNYHEPGQGNLRGYLKGSFGVNELVAFNLEFGDDVPFLSSRPDRFLGTLKFNVFGDVGWAFDTQNPIAGSPRVQKLTDDGVLNDTIADAGVGFTMHRTLPFYDLFLRFDMPFWVGQPQINGDSVETKFRYQFSLSATF